MEEGTGREVKMDWYSEKARVKCPYYCDHSYPRPGSNPTIACSKTETIPECCNLQLRFKTKEDRERYMEMRCHRNFELCPFFRIISESIEE